MIDIEAIKDDKPRKGPHKMSKSVKCEARRRYKAERSYRRKEAYFPPTDEDVAWFRKKMASALGLPKEYLFPLAPTTGENND